jgi:hypothetical protein
VPRRFGQAGRGGFGFRGSVRADDLSAPTLGSGIRPVCCRSRVLSAELERARGPSPASIARHREALLPEVPVSRATSPHRIRQHWLPRAHCLTGACAPRERLSVSPGSAGDRAPSRREPSPEPCERPIRPPRTRLANTWRARRRLTGSCQRPSRHACWSCAAKILSAVLLLCAATCAVGGRRSTGAYKRRGGCTGCALFVTAIWRGFRTGGLCVCQARTGHVRRFGSTEHSGHFPKGALGSHAAENPASLG